MFICIVAISDGHSGDFKLSPKSKFFYQREQGEVKSADLNNNSQTENRYG
jgi:hypothetical protein